MLGWGYNSANLVASAMILGALFFGSTALAGLTERGLGEDIRYVVEIEMSDPFLYIANVTFEVHAISTEEGIADADRLREIYETDPDEILDLLELEIVDSLGGRIRNATDCTSVQISSYTPDEGSLSGSASPGDPVKGEFVMNAVLSPDTLVPSRVVERVDPERMRHLAAALLKSGSVLRKDIEFSAGPGESVVYNLISRSDPLGDESIEILLRERGHGGDPPPIHTVSVTGSSVEETETLSIEIASKEPIQPMNEVVDGSASMDVPDLDTAYFSADLAVSSVGIEGRAILGDIPESMILPAYIGAGTIRYLYLEGAIDDEDLSALSDGPVEDLRSDLEEALDTDVPLKVDYDLCMTGLEEPSSGEDIVSILEADDPIMVLVGSEGGIDPNITKEYDPDDVLGLLNGGLEVSVDLGFWKADYPVSIVLPEDLAFTDVNWTDLSNGRRTYDLPRGPVMIGSVRAPDMPGESVDVSGTIDLSDVESLYLLDAKARASIDLTISIHWIDISSSDLGSTIGIDHRLDKANADLVRILVRMGVVNATEIEDEIRSAVGDFLGDLIDVEVMDVTLIEETLGFDEDLLDVNGEDPIRASITASSELDVLDPKGNGNHLKNGFLPFHADPVIPVKEYEKSIPLERVSGWTLDLDLVFPSGCGIEGWLGAEDGEWSQRLGTGVKDGDPVLSIETEPDQYGYLFLKVSGGAYMGFNNAILCFGLVWAVLLMTVLLVSIKIVVGIVRRRRLRRNTVQPKVGVEDLDPTKLVNDRKTSLKDPFGDKRSSKEPGKHAVSGASAGSGRPSGKGRRPGNL